MRTAPWTILSVVGTRPNFMKTAPVLRELDDRDGRFRSVLVHTGQHYDDEMSSVFIEQLGLPAPQHFLGVGSGSHAEQTARVLERLAPVIEQERPDLVLVPGDVNSTMAAALAAVKLDVPVAHLEAGLRSFDRTMPEEVNRVVTDAVADLHLTHSPEAREHLLREGARADTIHEVGNTMIDTLTRLRDRPEVAAAPGRHDLVAGEYLLVTLHRPALVDGPLLRVAVERLAEIARDLPVVFPAHPRTRSSLESLPAATVAALRVLPPLPYLEFLGLLAHAAGVLTDSGGIQEETTVLGVPCFTLRENTERPITVELGTNTVLGLDPDRIADVPELLRQALGRERRIPALWDGSAAARVVDAIEAFLAQRP